MKLNLPPIVENPMRLAVMPQPPVEAGWYFVQFRATEWPRAIWVWDGGEMWGSDPTDDPELLDMTADYVGNAREQFNWRRSP